MEFDTLFNHLDDTTLRQLEQEFPLSENHPAAPSRPSLQLAAPDDFERLVKFTEPLVAKYDDISSAEWEQSQIGWIRQVSSALKRGKIGEELVTAWARSEGVSVTGRSHRGHDVVLGGLKVEVKTSLKWNNDRFVFLGLRDFDYDAVALLGLEPDNVRLWVVPKALLWRHARQQLRSAGSLDTKWLAFHADDPPSWLQRWGGSFAQARLALADAAAYHHGASDSDREQPSPAHHLPDDQAWLQLATQIDWPWHSTPEDHVLNDANSPPQDHLQTATDSTPEDHLRNRTDCTPEDHFQPHQRLQHHQQQPPFITQTQRNDSHEPS
jgi:hypothetical protein